MLSRNEKGIVGVNLALTIAFALFAVIELSRVTLAAKQIDDRVKVIITEVGPGSNVSRLDETQKLNETGRMAEDILTAAKPLSGQAQQIIDTAKSIDGTVSNILQNASEINGTVKSIQGTANALLPVVQTIHGDDSLNVRTGGVAAINKRVATAQTVVPGIQVDLSRANILGTLVNVDTHANAICAPGTLVGSLGAAASCAGPVQATAP
ncbi:MAG: hypothetical protein LC708_00190 [Actinobacteria bacterium]|nr:hypothetical protein [Actinomycetota bacterium]